MYSTDFIELVKEGVVSNSYIGTGNPNAKILIIGKEAAIDQNDLQNNPHYISNAQKWDIHIAQKTCECLDYIPEDKALRKAGHTWRKYQKLHDFIFMKTPLKEDKYRIDFLKNVFTTEMNDAPSKRTNSAQKRKDFKIRLEYRKNTFFRTPFIQQFPVIVLACGNYIVNDDKKREIDTIFGVKYIASELTQNLPFWIHMNDDKSKLVIHTYQLSGSIASNELLEKIGEVIRNFLSERASN